MSKLAFPLDTIRIASPCAVPWDAMSGDERTRFCLQCQRHVYNLAEMSRNEAEALVQQTEGRLCVRFYRRKDGTVMTSDCPIGLRALRRRVALAASLVAGAFFMVLGGGMALLAGTRNSEVGSRRLREIEPFRTVMEWIDPTPPPVFLMGDICLPPGRQELRDDPPVDIFKDIPEPHSPPQKSAPEM
jgi:hypothetical protein